MPMPAVCEEDDYGTVAEEEQICDAVGNHDAAFSPAAPLADQKEEMVDMDHDCSLLHSQALNMEPELQFGGTTENDPRIVQKKMLTPAKSGSTTSQKNSSATSTGVVSGHQTGHDLYFAGCLAAPRGKIDEGEITMETTDHDASINTTKSFPKSKSSAGGQQERLQKLPPVEDVEHGMKEDGENTILYTTYGAAKKDLRAKVRTRPLVGGNKMIHEPFLPLQRGRNVSEGEVKLFSEVIMSANTKTLSKTSTATTENKSAASTGSSSVLTTASSSSSGFLSTTTRNNNYSSKMPHQQMLYTDDLSILVPAYAQGISSQKDNVLAPIPRVVCEEKVEPLFLGGSSTSSSSTKKPLRQPKQQRPVCHPGPVDEHKRLFVRPSSGTNRSTSTSATQTTFHRGGEDFVDNMPATLTATLTASAFEESSAFENNGATVELLSKSKTTTTSTTATEGTAATAFDHHDTSAADARKNVSSGQQEEFFKPVAPAKKRSSTWLSCIIGAAGGKTTKRTAARRGTIDRTDFAQLNTNDPTIKRISVSSEQTQSTAWSSGSERASMGSSKSTTSTVSSCSTSPTNQRGKVKFSQGFSFGFGKMKKQNLFQLQSNSMCAPAGMERCKISC
ncbi:unnamed protein product [Amoebophrya sp. A120]|nr:unnamed protein product [Amoebophrya sp. A120]|eukprot:GSA120T00015726001.1